MNTIRTATALPYLLGVAFSLWLIHQVPQLKQALIVDPATARSRAS